MAAMSETFATEALGRFVRSPGRSTFPQAVAHRRLLVKGTTTTVAIRLALRSSLCTTTTGRRKPGPEPTGSGSDAQKTSPRLTTTR